LNFCIKPIISEKNSITFLNRSVNRSERCSFLQSIQRKIIINNFPNPPNFPQTFGIMCVTTRKERGNDRPEAILSNKISLTQLQDLLSQQSPETEDERYAYDIIQKAYWINEKKIEMLDYKKNNKLIKNYFNQFQDNF